MCPFHTVDLDPSGAVSFTTESVVTNLRPGLFDPITFQLSLQLLVRESPEAIVSSSASVLARPALAVCSHHSFHPPHMEGTLLVLYNFAGG